jgi:hypothetical protein
LEMVRQMFEEGVLQSGFWHLFAMTAHSPVGLDPMDFGVARVGPDFGGFADNDLEHEDSQGAEHELFSQGLRVSLFNYMHGAGFDLPLQRWFDFKVPKTSVQSNYIRSTIQAPAVRKWRSNALAIWTGAHMDISIEAEPKTKELRAYLVFSNKKQENIIETSIELGQWLAEQLPKMQQDRPEPYSFQAFEADFNAVPRKNYANFAEFVDSHSFAQLQENGLIVV